MPLTTACVGVSVIPTVLSTWFSHYLDRKTRHLKPTAHISYDEGLNVVRAFLKHAAHHTVEDLQSFTAQKIPSPTWVKVKEQVVPNEHLSKAADHVNAQLGERGIKRVGGKTWWQWRVQQGDLKCEWIEMKSDYRARRQANGHCKRVMLYVHGGAYFFGTAYRLSPQFPFPCGLQDCLAAYLYLLTMQDPTEIILAGDSAGGGMVLAMLVILRDQGIPLPAGAILISPWADLTHSFPSVAKASNLDYIPEHGFMHRPSRSWPPPNSDDLAYMYQDAHNKEALNHKVENHQQTNGAQKTNDDQQTAIQGFAVREGDIKTADHTYPGLHTGIDRVTTADIGTIQADNVVVQMEDNTVVEIKDQIQMYAPNQMLTHPLVSPVLQPSLGGLPPLLILTGGGELLRDEQIYLAHKAADPMAYLPADIFLDEHDPDRTIIHKYGPTNVQLQVWDDLCHVAPTLSWTRPAKFMYRSIAQFGAWALAHAQHEDIDIPEDDASSISSESSSTSDNEEPTASVGVAGDPLPPFRKHMIRQRVDRHGMVYHLDPPSSLPALQQPREKVGALNPPIVKKWLSAKKAWDERFAKEKLTVQRRRLKEFEKGYLGFDGELPPACSMASRRMEEDLAPAKVRKSYGMMMWSLLGSKHDKEIITREAKEDTIPHVSNVPSEGKEGQGDTDIVAQKTRTSRKRSISKPDRGKLAPPPADERSRSRPRNRSRIVSDAGQAKELEVDHSSHPALRSGTSTPVILIPGVDTNDDSQSGNKTTDNASTMTLLNADGVLTTTDASTMKSSDLHSLSLSEQNGSATATISDSGPYTPSIITTDAAPDFTMNESNASTIALRHVPYILKKEQEHDAEKSEVEIQTRSSTVDEVSPHAECDTTNGETPNASAYEAKEAFPFSEKEERPQMPDREEFVTAEEIQS
ncbi:lipase/esterase family protein [Talaromyces stipitatus ATCC 10500]|uniref:Lipase/esterase family protein n=1 Tax=Talaromyces stipitatus (strain ATCC 10500 / CBS 375.48 / QM 6759 / NRRL 1006) TaxID=441959 RepID=B8M173_TALSN|nr:lipase/esterase family protein [Talaromyces stipitatus ATCC 10500]EED21015.1 lipase/esterase family protein [Talaromyces stipitatus ATCC 10500]